MKISLCSPFPYWLHLCLCSSNEPRLTSYQHVSSAITNSVSAIQKASLNSRCVYLNANTSSATYASRSGSKTRTAARIAETNCLPRRLLGEHISRPRCGPYTESESDNGKQFKVTNERDKLWSRTLASSLRISALGGRWFRSVCNLSIREHWLTCAEHIHSTALKRNTSNSRTDKWKRSLAGTLQLDSLKASSRLSDDVQVEVGLELVVLAMSRADPRRLD